MTVTRHGSSLLQRGVCSFAQARSLLCRVRRRCIVYHTCNDTKQCPLTTRTTQAITPLASSHNHDASSVIRSRPGHSAHCWYRQQTIRVLVHAALTLFTLSKSLHSPRQTLACYDGGKVSHFIDNVVEIIERLIEHPCRMDHAVPCSNRVRARRIAHSSQHGAYLLTMLNPATSSSVVVKDPAEDARCIRCGQGCARLEAVIAPRKR